MRETDACAAAERLVDVLERQAGGLGQLLLRRVAAQLDLEPARGPAELLLALDDVDGHANRARVVGDGALNGLANPPGRVRGELEAAAPVELLDGAVETQRALLDEVEERDAEAAVALGDRDDEAEVRLDHAPLREQVALLDALRERDFLGGGQKLVAADVGQEELQAVAGALDGRPRRSTASALLGGRADLEADRLELVRDLGDLLVAEVELERERLELCRLDVAALFGGLDQGAARLDRVKSFVHGVLTHVVLLGPFAERGRTDCGSTHPTF